MYASARDFRADLVKADVLLPLATDGVYARSKAYDAVTDGVSAASSRAGADLGALRLSFPPIMPRSSYAKTGYLRSFPDLTGAVDVFTGGDREHRQLLAAWERGEDWATALTASEVMLVSAACHPLYELQTGTLPAGGRHVELSTSVFRHEPSLDAMRMQSFRQHEFVYLGTPAAALAHRDDWVERATRLLTSLGLSVRAEVANDPFFGRLGALMAEGQRATELKYELLVDISDEGPSAITSANYHLDHFGEPFDIFTDDGAIAHSSCVGIGVDRVALALFARHGMSPGAWPADVRAALNLS